MTEEVRYYKDHLNIFVDETKGTRRMGGFCVSKDYLFFASPVNNYVAALHVPTGKVQLMTTGAKNSCGCVFMVPDGDELWLLPYEGYIITRWNPESGEVREYDCRVEGLQSRHPVYGYACDTTPFGYPAVLEDTLYLPPSWGNLYLRLDKSTGEIKVWEPPFGTGQKGMSGYYTPAGEAATFLQPAADETGILWQIYTYADHRLYEINLQTDKWREIVIEFLPEQLKQQEKGFHRISEWSMYAAGENAVNTLSDFLNGTLKGSLFDVTGARQEFQKIAANSDGTCGARTYAFIADKLAER